jgi:membrane fusion protein, multidrug efflux system
VRMVGFVIAAAAVLAGCGEPVRVQSAGVGPVTGVSTVAATVVERAGVYETAGTVKARSAATISAKWMGFVREVKVSVGDRVSAGQLLVTLDARDLDAAAGRARAGRDEARAAIPEAESGIAAARANLELAQTTFRRMKELYGKKSISDQEFDEASARLRSAEAAEGMARAKRAQLDARIAQADQEIRAADVARSYAEVTAPFAGIVTVKSVEPGNLAAPGAPLLTIEGGGYRLEAEVEQARTVRAGEAVSVTLDGVARTIAARVSEVVPSVNAASRAYTVKIDLPSDAAIRSGVFGRASFAAGGRSELAIPAAAVIRRGQLESVFVVDGGVARLRMVTLGTEANGSVAVRSGLSAGERVIAPVRDGLEDGARVEARP